MTDERIKEAAIKQIDTYLDMGCFKNPETIRPALIEGYEMGFRAAERLAKIEELEDMSRMMDKLRFFSVADYKDAKDRIDTMIAELKEAGE